MKKGFVRTIAAALSTVTVLTALAAPASAAVAEAPKDGGELQYSYTNKSLATYSYDISLNQTDIDFLNKVIAVRDFYYFDKGNVCISLTKETLMNTYGFTDDQYSRLVKTVLVSFKAGATGSANPEYSTRAFVRGGALYITHDDLTAGTFAVLGAAASAGPAAMAAAITALSSMIPPPVGQILGAVVTIAAAPSLVELCGRVVYALATRQGIYLKLILSYPPLEIGYW